MSGICVHVCMKACMHVWSLATRKVPARFVPPIFAYLILLFSYPEGLQQCSGLAG